MLLLSLPLLIIPISAIHAANPIPFHSPYLESHSSPLLRRDGNCPVSFSSCSSLSPSYGAACCSSTSLCALDEAENIACCPTGSKCTGILSSTPTATITSAPASTVSNPYFPYPYIPTSFDDNAQCTSMSSQCAQNFQACTADLQGGFGVTIMVPGGSGVTVAPKETGGGSGGGVAVADAASVCSSLSSKACEGASGGCATWGTADGTTDGAFVVAASTSENVARARVTGMGMGMAGVGVVGLGVVRGMM